MTAAASLDAIPARDRTMAVARIETAYQALRRQRRNAGLLAVAILAVAFVASAVMAEFYPARLAAGLPRVGEYFAKLVPDLRWEARFAGPRTEGSVAYWFYRIDEWAWLIFETANMAALATLMGAVGALLLCFPAAANLAPNVWAFRFVRRFLELFRTVPEIVYALILVWAFGVGPLAGILAIALHTTGALGKLFAEAVENTDMRPWEGVRAAGGTWLMGVRYAIVPQVLPDFLSYVLLRFEINVRGASVIGFVGAGGIGQEIYQVIAFSYYEEIGAIVLLVVLTVAMIDLVSERLRHGVIGRIG